jgi:Flp pilus assembly protein TadB
MSENSSTPHADDPSLEPWLIVMFSALVPALTAVYVPAAFAITLIAAAVLLLIIGVVMLKLQTARRARESRREENASA